MAISITPEVSSLLQRCSIEGTVLKLPEEQLARPIYEAVNKVITALGGKWNRSKGGHVFPFDPSPKIADALGQGSVISRQQALQHFDTPPELAQRLVAKLDISSADRCLEPSAGRGNLVEALIKCGPSVIVAVEIDADNAAALEDQGHCDNIFVKDFCEFAPATGFFTAIAMNPPFKGNQDIRHVRRAFDMLAEGGRLAAIVSEHSFFAADSESVSFQQWLAAHDAEVEDIPTGAFKQSGTGVKTRMIVIRKNAP